MPTPYEHEAALFALAAEKPEAERNAFLQAVCGQDAALRERLDALLAAHEQPNPLLGGGAAAVTVKLTESLKGNAEPPDESVGQALGRYKLLERVGEGGCGVVYVAEQTEPVRRRVALKVIKLGMDTKEVIARFEAERQALAMMDHPNIAKVLDAGTTETGRPYFVMELVRGIRITDYCDQANLSTRERLDLFIKVCQAIQHAHQKGIIHRDIKPSNILVTLHDGVPVPKVIDFGIAKAIEGRLTEATVYTQLHQFIGTPAYMSPEQAEMSGLDIDTRSDIYSLGVLLYELLAGSTPFDARELMASGIDAMRRTIREKEPMRPSTRVATLDGDLLTTTARRRSAESSKLLHQLKGDLDWIVMKCLEKDRTRRYETANGLAADLRRHIENEPVIARPPSAIYRLQKAFRRNKLVFAAGTAVIVALVAGLSMAAVGWRQTSLERDKALRAKAAEEAQRLEAQASEKKAKLAEAEQVRLREQAEAQTLAARRSAYNSDMNQIQQMLRLNNLGEAQRLLERQRPAAGQADLRGWEWRYLWGQARADEHEVFFEGRGRVIRSLGFSADGRLLARRLNGERLTVTEVASRRIVFQPPNAFVPAFTHHDSRLAFIQHTSAGNDLIRIVDTNALQPDLSAPKEIRIETSWTNTLWLEFTGDDRRLLTVSTRPDIGPNDELPYHLTAWDPGTGAQLWQRPIQFSVKWLNRRPMATSPDGSAIVLRIPEGSLQVIEAKDGSERFTNTNALDTAYVIIFSPDSSTILTGFGLSAIQLIDARTGAAGEALEGHSAYVTDLAFTPDGKRLISSSADQTIRIWDWDTRKTLSVLRCPPGVFGLSVAPDGWSLATRGVDGTIALWDLTKPSRRIANQTLPGTFFHAEFTQDSRSILGIEAKGGVALWDIRTLNETRRLWGDTEDRSVISPNAAWALRTDDSRHLHVWNVATGEDISKPITPFGPLVRALFTQNGKFLVTRSGPDANTVLEAWDTSTWQRKASLALRFKRIESWPGGFTPSLANSYVLMADGALRFFDAANLGEPKNVIESANGIYGFATSPDGRLAAGAYKGGTVHFWDMVTLQPLDTFKTFLLDARSAAFSHDGQRLAVSSTGMEAIKLWDTVTRHELVSLSGGGEFQHLSFSPDGRYLMAINNQDVAHIWSAPTMEEIQAVESKERVKPSE